MPYADYLFYQESFGGTVLDAAQFNAVAVWASAYVDAVTWGRLRRGWPVTDAVRMACCAVAEVMVRYLEARQAEASRGLGLLSADNDGYKETYASGSALAEQADAEQKAAVDLYIPPGDPLRYAGGDPPCWAVTRP